MNWLIISLSIYLVFYIHNIYSCLKVSSELDHLLKVFYKVNEEINQQNIDSIYDIDTFPIRQKLIKEMPRIKFVLPSSLVSLRINHSTETLYDNFRSILSDLIAKQDEIYYNRFSIFNPFNPLKSIFLIPSKILSWFGINFSLTAQRWFSLISWVVGLLFKEFLYGALNSVIQNLVK